MNDNHGATIVNYMRFARYQRGQRLRAVEACFQDLKDSRCVTGTGVGAILTAFIQEHLLDRRQTSVGALYTWAVFVLWGSRVQWCLGTSRRDWVCSVHECVLFVGDDCTKVHSSQTSTAMHKC